MTDEFDIRLEQTLLERGEGLAVGLGFTLGDYLGNPELPIRAAATLTTAATQPPQELPPSGVVLLHAGTLARSGTPFRLAWFLGEPLRALIAEVAGGAEGLEERLENLARELADVAGSDAYSLGDSRAVVTDDCWTQYSAEPPAGETITWLRFELSGLDVGARDLWLAYPTPVVESMLATSDPPAPLEPRRRDVSVAPPAASPPTSRETLNPSAPNVRRLLRTNVPIIVTLADKRLPTSRLVDIGPGSIIEFERPCDEPLQLSANNLPIGVGEAVKIGDHFGLKVTAILSPEQRAQRLAGRSPPT